MRAQQSVLLRTTKSIKQSSNICSHPHTANYHLLRFIPLYRFPDFFVYPRGHNGILRDDVFKLGFNYSLPLFYPDLPIPPLAFIKRVKANFFYDYGSFKSDIFNSISRQSAGVELTMDMRFFRLVEIDWGVRYSYLVEKGDFPTSPHQFDFLVISITE